MIIHKTNRALSWSAYAAVVVYIITYLVSAALGIRLFR